MIDVIPILAIVFGSFLGIIVVVLIFAAYTQKKEKQYRLALAQLEKSSPEETKEKEIIKEIVLIPCQYCGSLIPQTSLFCNNCGARRKL